MFQLKWWSKTKKRWQLKIIYECKKTNLNRLALVIRFLHSSVRFSSIWKHWWWTWTTGSKSLLDSLQMLDILCKGTFLILGRAEGAFSWSQHWTCVRSLIQSEGWFDWWHQRRDHTPLRKGKITRGWRVERNSSLLWPQHFSPQDRNCAWSCSMPVNCSTAYGDFPCSSLPFPSEELQSWDSDDYSDRCSEAV